MNFNKHLYSLYLTFHFNVNCNISLFLILLHFDNNRNFIPLKVVNLTLSFLKVITKFDRLSCNGFVCIYESVTD